MLTDYNTVHQYDEQGVVKTDKLIKALGATLKFLQKSQQEHKTENKSLTFGHEELINKSKTVSVSRRMRSQEMKENSA